MKFLLNIAVFISLVTLVTAHFTITTYNLWNIMFNWQVRKFRISQLIRESGADIVTFQEVRKHVSGRNQMHDIQELLPWYKYQISQTAHQVVQKPHSYKLEWGDEGIGLISQHPIISSSVQPLIYHEGVDTNQRLVLHVTIRHRVLGDILVSVVHLSYDRHQQCDNVIQIMDYIAGSTVKNKIILGDFNAYSNFDQPTRLLINSNDRSALETCKATSRVPSSRFMDVMGHFQDGWLAKMAEEDGFTFSNMPEPGLESRPDRIYVSKNLEVMAGDIKGHGVVYKEKFYVHVIWSRASSVLGAMYDAKSGLKGRSCLHDCGPHASCRCGVCVSGGDKNTCLVPDCEECLPSMYTTFWLFSFIAILLFVQLIYAVIRVLQTMNDRSHKPCVNLPFCDWFCLCDSNLFSNMSNASHRSKRSRYLSKLCPQCRLPPMVLVFSTLCVCTIFMHVFTAVFSGAINDVYAIIPEEFYPSDHLMLSIRIKVPS